MSQGSESETRSVRVHFARSEGPRRSRGALDRPQGRFETSQRESVDDGWLAEDAAEGGALANPDTPTQVTEEQARSIVSTNDSPDVPFDRSINPYRGCEHGCIYCYARPSHAYLELSPGLDFETRIHAKTNARQLLAAELARAGYVPSPIALGANTDAYQPVERRYRITRQIVELLSECEHPFTVVTKSALVERDLDLLGPMASKNLVRVYVSIATLDHEIASRLEPRAASPQRRLDILRALAAHGIPCGVMLAPVVPALTDKSVEEVLSAAKAAGAQSAGYIVMRLPYELKELFKDWLEAHYPLRASHVMSVVEQMRGGRENDPRFATRMSGTGLYADLLKQRFAVTCQRLGLDAPGNAGRFQTPLDTSRFRPPPLGGQMRLF